MGRLAGQTVVVVGAGIAGLAMARALALRGADVQLVEQAEEIREVGAGLQIAPNGAKVLRAMGLGEDLTRIGLRAQAVQLLNGQTGARVATMDLTRRAQDQDYYFVHRADLIEMLHQRALAAGVTVNLGVKIASVDLDGDAPQLQLAAGQSVGGALVIGADGLHSVLRRAVCGIHAPFFTGQVAWRATIAGDGGPNIVQVHMGAGRHVVSYPLRGGALRNIVAVQERSAWVRESWSQRADHAHFAAAFADFAPQVRGWIEAAQDAGLWGLFRHQMAEKWGRILPQGAVFLLGDAAHPTLPFLAQGASMGLEDGAILANLLDSLPPAEALSRYQNLRAPRVARILRAANANAKNYHLSGLSRVLAHTGLRALSSFAPDLMVRRFDWLYEYDAAKIVN
ncbi:MAG: FAD-dependent monooxygenase [Cypionkella sp.]|nr:FAD-dependent monooxygenase [Cypionkella sp.]